MLKLWKEPFLYPKPGTAAEALPHGNPPAASDKPKSKAKAKNASGTLRRMWSYLIAYKGRLFSVIAMVVLSSAFSLLGPYLAGTAIDHYLINRGSGFIRFLAAMAAVYALHSLTMWLQSVWMITVSQQTVYRMRVQLFEHLHRLPIPYFSKRQHGELMSRVTNDIENVSSSLNSSVIQLLSSVLLLIGTVTVMLTLSPALTLLTFLVVPLMVLGMKWITERTGKLFKAQQRNLGDLNGYIEETLSGQRIVKAFSQERTVIEAFRERNERIRVSGFWAQAISGFIPKLMNALNNLSFAIIAGIGAVFALNGAITVGVIVIFAEYSRQFTRPLNDLANQWNTLLSAVAGAERVFDVLAEEEERTDESSAVELSGIRGEVVFKHVSFAYEGRNSTIQDVSFRVKPGETLALVGPTGAGKTTLIQLLCRFYDPSSGSVTIDGMDTREIKRESLRSQMAFVLQDPFLFEGTIRENIRYGKLDASDEEVERAAMLANAHSFIVRMKGGYDAMLKMDGSGISQGQKQLLAIARAILANPSILVLDEATSSIDTVTEIKIQEALQRLMEGRTSFVIAHRLNTIRQADQIVVLQEGAIVEKGSHETLLGKQGYYSKMVKGHASND
ncbi:ABC transporter ATP-binding protein/permease [Paenibacillus sp. N4]|uniref:ABC transporter ATP-binding protein n=1 Tax=Paenibacillus vietnamensis TaxID=2590547 RepID=UPI001CD04E6E|nr:ABC transporter ATP-binding protein [Paenibacillus vietnamensis]MCA0755445.1 ABC transporter ATP-binding protein/permease [Paenibacillus vietnamensis]